MIDLSSSSSSSSVLGEAIQGPDQPDKIRSRELCTDHFPNFEAPTIALSPRKFLSRPTSIRIETSPVDDIPFLSPTDNPAEYRKNGVDTDGSVLRQEEERDGSSLPGLLLAGPPERGRKEAKKMRRSLKDEEVLTFWCFTQIGCRPLQGRSGSDQGQWSSSPAGRARHPPNQGTNDSRMGRIPGNTHALDR